MKRFSVFVAVFFCVTTLLFAHGKKDAAKSDAEENPAISEQAAAPEKKGATLQVATLNGPTSIPVAYLYEHAPDIPGTDVEFTVLASAPLELPKLIKGEVQIGVLPANAAAKVFTANNGALVALGVCGTGNLFLLTRDISIRSLASLRGKTVACAGQGATPEYVFTYLLRKAGISVGEGERDVRLDFSIANADLPAALLANKVSSVLVPEPFATVAEMRGQEIIRAIDLQKEYASVEDGASYPMTLLVANAQYAETHKDAVNAFVDAYRDAVAWTNENPNKAGVLVQKHTLGLMAPVAAKAIPSGGYVWVDAPLARESVERLLGIYLSFAPEAIGGKLPDDAFYYKR